MSCLLLENGLPEEIDGVPIYADYRNMIRFEQLLDDDALADAEKTILGVRQLFDELPPGGVQRAVDRLQWFYLRGQEMEKEDEAATQRVHARAYDLVEDAGCIYASFLQAYRMDLTTIPFLHWWAFTALLENLPEDTPMAQRMQLRMMDTSALKDAKLRKKYADMQRKVALPQKAHSRNHKVETLSDRVHRRYREAQAAVAEEHKD